jgi:hypothetical protein
MAQCLSNSAAKVHVVYAEIICYTVIHALPVHVKPGITFKVPQSNEFTRGPPELVQHFRL